VLAIIIAIIAWQSNWCRYRRNDGLVPEFQVLVT
jgi:hypothetical protein